MDKEGYSTDGHLSYESELANPRPLMGATADHANLRFSLPTSGSPYFCQLADVECRSCQGSGIQVYAEAGETLAERCHCIPSLGYSNPDFEALQRLEQVANRISKAGIPAIFANASYKGKPFELVAPIELLDWLEHICSARTTSHENFLFLCGSVGNGKTHMASDCVKRFMYRTEREARFLQAEDLIDAKRESDIYGDRRNRHEKDHLDYQRRVVKYAGLLVVDEIGRSRISKWGVDTFERFIDARYQSGLPTILISNHTFDAKTSLDGVTIDKVVGHRTCDRIREFVKIELSGPSKRISPKRSPRVPKLSEEQMSTYCLPKPILMQKEGELQILNWITRNPVFETINDRDRRQARDAQGNPIFNHGVCVDEPRSEIKVCHDVWQKGDQLVMEGPILGIDDAKMYLTCLDSLREQHRKNHYGLKLPIRVVELLSKLSKTDCKDNRQATHRSLLRLSKATITYTDNTGRHWVGPLITSFFDPSNQLYEISFNQSMVTFYETCEYTRLHKSLFEAKIGTDGLRMQMFLRSHDQPTFDRLTFDGWMKFLEKPIEQMDSSSEGKKVRRRHRKKFSELLKKQVEAGLLTTDSCLKRGNSRLQLTVTPLEI